MGLSLLNVEVSGSNSDTPNSARLLLTRDRPVPELYLAIHNTRERERGGREEERERKRERGRERGRGREGERGKERGREWKREGERGGERGRDPFPRRDSNPQYKQASGC